MFHYEPLTHPFIEDLLDRSESSFLFLPLSLLALAFLGGLIYILSLDPFRAERPWGLVYLNVFPVSVFIGAVFIPLIFNKPDMTNPWQAVAVLGSGFLFPAVMFGMEAVAARTLLAFGRWFDEAGRQNAAYFFLKSSLRWRPSVHETARRCGLLLVETGRFRAARGLLERLGPIPASEDYEVLKALERAYHAEGDARLALKCLQRQQTLRPNSKGLDQRILDQSLALESWEDAIALLESGRIFMDLEKLVLLHELYARTGNLAKALAVARQVEEKEASPHTRAVALFRGLLKKNPDNSAVMTELGSVLQKSGVAEQTEEGAGHLEQVLARDPQRTDLRRQLAGYYQQTLQYQKAEGHYQRLIADESATPEIFLGYAEMLKGDGRANDARDIYRQMRAAFKDDWRAYFREAEVLFLLGHLDEAIVLLDQSHELIPEGARMNPNMLRRKIDQRHEELRLQAISKDLAETGEDVQKRLEYAERLIGLDRGEQAVAECDALLEKHPDLMNRVQQVVEKGIASAVHGFRLRDYLADLYFRQGRYDDALAMFSEMAPNSLHPEKVIEEGCRKILSRVPDHLRARMTLEEVLLKTSNWEGALANYEPLMGDPPKEERLKIQTQWITAAYHAGKIAPARELALSIAAECSKDLPFLLLLIRILEDSGDYRQAFEIFKIASENFPTDETLENMRKTVADNKKRERMEELQTLDAQNKLTPADHYEKAELHRQFGQIHHAIGHYQRAANDPELADLATTKLAICLCDRRLFDLADETLDAMELTQEKAARNPELKSMYYWIADTLEQELLKKSALKYFKRLFRVDASFRDVVVRLEKLDGA